MLQMELIHNLCGGIRKVKMELMDSLARRHSISIMTKQSINNGNLIFIFSDIFIPAAFEKSINIKNAHKFNCKLIV